MPRAAAHIPLAPMPVRGLRAGDAARYVGMGETTFRELADAGKMPRGFKVGAMRLWDIRDLDEAFEALKNAGPVYGGYEGVVP